jgi:hypothetical protein
MEMGRILAFFYGLLAYVVFLAAFLYAIGFIAGLVSPQMRIGRTLYPNDWFDF